MAGYVRRCACQPAIQCATSWGLLSLPEHSDILVHRSVCVFYFNSFLCLLNLSNLSGGKLYINFSHQILVSSYTQGQRGSVSIFFSNLVKSESMANLCFIIDKINVVYLKSLSQQIGRIRPTSLSCKGLFVN